MIVWLRVRESNPFLLLMRQPTYPFVLPATHCYGLTAPMFNVAM